MTPNDYQTFALRTISADLTDRERLELCGLALSGEIGEVTDLLKKYLYHQSGKPLDMEKMKDELGDVLWHFAVLLSTLGLTFEEVIQANIAKLQARRPGGFTPQYPSDSGASV